MSDERIRTADRGGTNITRGERDEWARRAEAAERELARLREGLREIAHGYDGDEFRDSADAIDEARDIARALLAEDIPVVKIEYKPIGQDPANTTEDGAA